jgi:hypothetical protein
MTAPKLAHDTPFGRYYTHPTRGRAVPSITNIKDMKNVPALVGWAAKVTAEYAGKNREKLATLSEDEAISLCKNSRFAPDPESPSHIGDIVHGWVDARIKGDDVDPEWYLDERTGDLCPAPKGAQNMWRQFLGLEAKYRPDWTLSEFTVWSEQYGYAGTADAAANMTTADGKRYLTLIDHKTGKNAYPEMAMQLGAIANADFILEPDGTEKNLPHFDKFAILHIRPMGASLIPVAHTDKWFKAFLGLKDCFDCVVEYQDTTLLYAPHIRTRASGEVIVK